MDSMCVPVCPKNSGFVTGLDFKDIKLEIFTKSKINFIGISVFGYEDKKISNLCLKKCCEEKITTFFSKISIHSCITQYIKEKNIFITYITY